MIRDTQNNSLTNYAFDCFYWFAFWHNLIQFLDSFLEIINDGLFSQRFHQINSINAIKSIKFMCFGALKRKLNSVEVFCEY